MKINAIFETLEDRRLLSAASATGLLVTPLATSQPVLASRVALPRVLGTWTGTAKTSSGGKIALSFTILKETSAGVLSGSGRDVTDATSLTLTGHVYADGRVTLRLASHGGVVTTAAGKLSLANKRLTGTWSNNVHLQGTFTLNRV